MEAEIVFSGLCSFLNLNDSNATMPEPSVILIRTETAAAKQAAKKAEAAHAKLVGKDPQPIAQHTPFLAFDGKKVKVTGIAANQLTPVQKAGGFKFLELDGLELALNGTTGKPDEVDPSYADVINKDYYWGAASNRWNRDFVPERGKKPRPSAVAAYMRIGKGRIRAARKPNFDYEFFTPDSAAPTKINVGPRQFAEEVIYDNFPHDGDEVVLVLSDLATGKVRSELHFSPKPGNQEVTLFIGNIETTDIQFSVKRTMRDSPGPGTHLAFLNMVADSTAAAFPGPWAQPTAATVAAANALAANGGGGGASGFCGPGSANGA